MAFFVATPVVWLNLKASSSTIARLFWDQAMLESLFAGSLARLPARMSFDHRFDVPTSGGAIVVVPARHHAHLASEINEQVSHLDWLLLILTGDEESVFPMNQITHHNMKVWAQTPHSSRTPHRRLGDGWPPNTPEVLRDVSLSNSPRPLDWFFSGQVLEHPRRVECARVLRQMGSGYLNETQGFTQGLGQKTYLEQMSRARVAPCPSGPCTPDTFRLFEALEAGCVPVVDVGPDPDYWRVTFPDAPFPCVNHWDEFPDLLPALVDDSVVMSNRCFSWWQRHKASWGRWLAEDLERLAHPLFVGGPEDPTEEDLSDLVTVVVPTSPTELWPRDQVRVLSETVRTIRERLPGCEILLCFDGVREEQERFRSLYEACQSQALWYANHEWGHVTPYRFEEHTHQARMTARALEDVRTPLVLFVEHDTPLVGEVPWLSACDLLIHGHLDLLRFHHEASILQPHMHLMPDEAKVINLAGVPVARTVQWSQRPHLARTDFYRQILQRHFDLTAERWMIEDRMHSVVQCAWNDNGEEGWSEYRLAIYHPEGNIKRSSHLDARGHETKWGNVTPGPATDPSSEGPS